MKNSQRLAFYEAAYERIREEILPDAPPSVTLTLGFPSRKRSAGRSTVGECAFDCIEKHGEGFGGENLITLHLLQGDDVIGTLATLVHEMIHASLEPTVKHGHQFQQVCKRVGLCKPWTATEPDGDLTHKLRGILLELESKLGYVPVGHYVPPAPLPKKPSSIRKLACACAKPRKFSLSYKKLEEGAIICGVCDEPFRIIESPSLDAEEKAKAA